MANSFPSSIANIWTGTGSGGSYENLPSLFTDIATQIRAKDGTTAKILASDFPSRIRALSYPMPAKGSFIKLNLDGTERIYSVLKTEQSIATVLAVQFGYGNRTYAYGEETYAGGECDYMLMRWYNKLSNSVKSAFVATTIAQKVYSCTLNPSTAPSSYDYMTYSSRRLDYAYYFTLQETKAAITRYVFAIPFSYFFEYYNKKDLTGEEMGAIVCFEHNPFYDVDAWTLDTTTSYSGITYEMYSNIRGVYDDSLADDKNNEYCPCFRIDLSKIPWIIA